MGILLKYSGLRTLFLADLLSQAGSKIHRIALLFVAYDQTQNAVWVSVLLAAQLVASAVLGPILGPLVDRYDRRMLMVVSDLARAALVALIPLYGLDSMPVLLVLTVLISAFESVHSPAKNSSVPDLVSEEDLDGANALMGSAERISEVVFAALAGVLVASVGPAIAFWIDAASFVLSGLVILVLPRLPGRPEEGNYLEAVLSGLAPLWQNPTLRRTVGAFAVAAVFGSVEGALMIVLAVGVLGIGTQGFGALEAVQAASIVLGLALAPGLIKRFSREQVFMVSLLVFGLFTISLGLFPNVPWVFSAMVVIGIANALFLVPARSLVQLASPPELRGRIFAAYGAVMNSAVLVGMFLAGLLEPRWGAVMVLGLSGVAMVVVIGALMLRGGIPRPAS